MKLPFEFGTKFIFRLVFPGVVLAVAMLPLVTALLNGLSVSFQLEYLFPLEIVAFGWLVVVSDMPIYMAFEGRRYWPATIHGWLMGRERRRLAALDKAMRDIANRRRSLEAGAELGLYPIDEDGNPYVEHPTRIGNLIESFETYPRVKYGLDSVFYWYRLWIVLDKDLREEIDTAQALVDSTIYLAFSFYLSAILACGYAVFESVARGSAWARQRLALESLPYVPSPAVLVLVSAGCLLVGFAIYRLTLPAHAKFGELFKSVFDQYRGKLNFEDIVRDVGELIGDPQLAQRARRDKNMIVWRYLRWHRARDEAAGSNLTVGEWAQRKKAAPPTAGP